ncbi:MAG: AMP-dependent synthetase/ligase [Actinomycetes bacterium]
MSTLTFEAINEMVAGRTIVTEFLETVSANTDRVALRWQLPDESWGTMTFGDLAEKVAVFAGGLRSLGVSRGDRVVMMMRNVPDFHVTDLAALMLGATPISIYNSSAPDQVQYLVQHCGAKVAVVEDDAFAAKFNNIRAELPALESIVVLDPASDGPDGTVGHEVLTAATPIDLSAESGNAQPGDLATIIYTSGTTGNPKGVMLTHYNLCWTAESLIASFGWERSTSAGKKVVSYLPMAHIAERMTSHYSMVAFGYEVTTCPDVALLKDYLLATRPNLIFGVPRVWEKFHAGVMAALSADPDRAAQFADGVAAARPIVERLDWGTASDEDRATYEFLDAAAFSIVRGLLGLDECELAVTGAAPIAPDLLGWFRAIGVPLAEIYGMSESSGPMTFTATHVKQGSVGPAIPGTEVRIFDDGEVCIRGGNVFSGYLNEPEKTAEALDEEGWLHSGDIGVMDDEGYVRIVDRKKELIITAGGKNISPANLESALKGIQLVGQAAAIGDNRPFVSALVVLDPEVAPVWAAANGIEFTSLEELAQHPAVVEAIESELAVVMEPFNGAERVKKVRILGEEWLPDSDLLTPTSKLKRRGINARYADEIASLYG